MDREKLDQQLWEHFIHAKEHSWKHLTASQSLILSRRPCILVFAILTAAGATALATFYNGIGTAGELVTYFETTTNQSRQTLFFEHLYLDKGLYVVTDASVKGLLVVWHEAPQGIGYNY